MEKKSMFLKQWVLVVALTGSIFSTVACSQKSDDNKTGVEGNIANDGANVSTQLTANGYPSSVVLNGLTKDAYANTAGYYTGYTTGYTGQQQITIGFNLMLNGQSVRIQVQPSYQGYAYTYTNAINTQYVNGLVVQSETRCNDSICNGIYLHIIIRSNDTATQTAGYNYIGGTAYPNTYMIPKEIGVLKIVDQNRIAAVWERQTGELASMDQVIGKLESIKN